MDEFRKKNKIMYIEKIAPSCVPEPKPAVHRLHAEVPCNYILGRLAAALQNVPMIFVNTTILLFP